MGSGAYSQHVMLRKFCWQSDLGGIQWGIYTKALQKRKMILSKSRDVIFSDECIA